jgi:hypothetical protein
VNRFFFSSLDFNDYVQEPQFNEAVTVESIEQPQLGEMPVESRDQPQLEVETSDEPELDEVPVESRYQSLLPEEVNLNDYVQEPQFNEVTVESIEQPQLEVETLGEPQLEVETLDEPQLEVETLDELQCNKVAESIEQLDEVPVESGVQHLPEEVNQTGDISAHLVSQLEKTTEERDQLLEVISDARMKVGILVEQLQLAGENILARDNQISEYHNHLATLDTEISQLKSAKDTKVELFISLLYAHQLG